MLLSGMYQLKQPQEGVPRKKLLQKLDKKKGEELLIDHEKKYSEASAKQIIRLFTIPYKGKSQVHLEKSLRNACEKIVLNKFQVYSLQM